MQIILGVYLVNGFPYGQHQNGYVVRFGDKGIMIDSGDLATDTLDLVIGNCRNWGIEITDLSHLLITHAHFDHSSHAAKLQRMGLKIISSADTAEAMSLGDDRCLGYAVHRQYERCKVDLIVDDGDQLEIGKIKVRCISAPGHANGCIVYEVLLEGQILWFVGDVVFAEEECRGARLGWSGGPDYDRTIYLETLRKLCHMLCDCLFAGHYQPCIGNAQRILEMAYTKALIEWR